VASSIIKTWSTPFRDEKKRDVPCVLCGGLSFKFSLTCEGFYYVRCAACGLVQMNPQPLEEETLKRYGERSGEEYLSYELANEGSFLNLELLALKDAGFDEIEKKKSARGARLLDLGCAIGSLLALLRERGWETTGVEISGPEANYCRRERCLDVRSLPLKENNFCADHFDVVLASHLIEHLNDPAALIREVHRILKPGGRFFVTTPNISGFQARLFRGRWRSAIFDHLYLFSKKTLSKLLKENGFFIEKTVTWGGLAAGTAPAPLKTIFDKAAKLLGLGDVMIIRSRRD
jgi:2-polyprenyl-3-methyl-5-hydroxy-6-metoxy-1,4-benzoquinol methylase